MSVKAAGVGHFQIPTAPAALTAVTQSASANTLGSAVSFGNAPSALYITGVHIGVATTQVPTYVLIQILVAASVVAQVIVPYGVSAAAAASVLTGFRPIFPPIPVANAAAITVKSASSVASAVAWGVSLECIAQSNVVDDGITVGTVNLVNTLTTYTGNTVQTGDAYARLGAPAGASVSADVAAVKVDTAAVKVKTDFLPSATAGAAGGVFIAGSNAATTANFTGSLSGSVGSVTGAVGSVTGAVGSVTGAVGSVTGAVGSVTGNVGGNVAGSVASVTARVTANTDQLAGQTVTAAAGVTFPTSVASPTNITAGTITTVTNLTNAPTAGDLTAAMKTSVTTAATAATPTAAAVTGAVGSVSGDVGGNVVGSVASVTAAVVLPAIPANWITAAGIAAAALNGKGDWLLSSAYTAPDNTSIATLIARLTAARATNLDNLDAAVSSRMAGFTLPPNFSSLTISVAGAVTAGTVGDKTGYALTAAYDAAKTALAAASYTAPDNASVAAVKAQTDQLAFTVAGQADVNIKSVADTTVAGSGTEVAPWGPA